MAFEWLTAANTLCGAVKDLVSEGQLMQRRSELQTPACPELVLATGNSNFGLHSEISLETLAIVSDRPYYSYCPIIR
jgi:hypothetical protein